MLGIKQPGWSYVRQTPGPLYNLSNLEAFFVFGAISASAQGSVLVSSRDSYKVPGIEPGPYLLYRIYKQYFKSVQRLKKMEHKKLSIAFILCM